MAFEVIGRMHRLFATEQKSSGFQAREFVLEIPDGNYPQLVKFQVVQDRCAILDRFSEGDQIKVAFDLRGREWNGKYLTNLNAWKVDPAAEGEQVASAAPSRSSNPAPPASESFPADPFPNYSDTPPPSQNFEDLPF